MMIARLRRLLISVAGLLNCIIPKNRKKIIFSSFPDFSDNAEPLFRYLIEHENKSKYRIIWLVNNDFKSSYNLVDLGVEEENNVFFCKKHSLQGFYNFITSAYVFFTHGIYSDIKIPESQIVVNLWHGTPIKNLGLLDGKSEIVKFRYLLSTSRKINGIYEKIFGIQNEKILVHGSPRNDYLFTGKINLAGITGNNSFKKLLLWMPTYRISVKGDIRRDGLVKDSGLPLLSKKDLNRLNDELVRLNYFLIIKLHPMDKECNKDGSLDKSNIRAITDRVLFEKKLHLYKLLASADVLLTDYSSVYIDFLLTDKPVGFLINDIEDYKSNRGFLFEDVENLMPGQRIRNYDQLVGFLEKIGSGTDEYKEKRKKVSSFFNEIADGRSSKRLLEFLNIQ